MLKTVFFFKYTPQIEGRAEVANTQLNAETTQTVAK